MPSASTTPETAQAHIPYAAYPFGAFAAQSILGVRPSTPSREGGGTA